MSSSPADRRLAAIMFTDLVGYSAMTQRDEKMALQLLEKHNEFIRPVLLKHNGAEVKTIGDSFLVEFGSALDAVECALELQKGLHDYNDEKPAAEKLQVRVGIHVGDVVHRGKDVFGDTVNIASRIQPLAQSGGVCISEQVYADVRNKLPLRITKLEPTQLKNIAFQINVYKIEMPWEGRPETESEEQQQLDLHHLAVLPFVNISPDPNDSYFADGLTEELIAKLSLIKGLKVIARTSVIKYKGKEKSITEIGRELRAGVVIEGSVRKAGNRIRVNIQAINANDEEQLWSASFNNNLDDIFAVQAEIAAKVSDSHPAYVLQSKPFIQISPDTGNVTAYTYYLRATQLLNDGGDESLNEALELYTQATKLDPFFARAYVGIGNCYAELGVRSNVSFEESVAGAKSAAIKALEVDPTLAEVHSLISFTAWSEDDFVKAEKEAKIALELNPNLAEVHSMLGTLLVTTGYPNSALEQFEMAYTLDPLSGESVRYLALMLAWKGRESEALDLLNRNIKIVPFEAHLALAEYKMSKQDNVKAEDEVRALEKIAPSDFRTICMRGFLRAMSGDKQGVEKTIEKLGTFKRGATYDRNIGYIKYMSGDMDGFFDAMFRAVEAHVLDPFRMRYSPRFEKARQDPRYRMVLEKNGLDPDLKEPLRDNTNN